MEETISAQKCKSENRIQILTTNMQYTDQKSSHVMEISIEVSLNRDCRNTRGANICLYSPDAAKLEFSEREYICGSNLVTYLSVTRDRIRAMYVSVGLQTFSVPY